MLKGTMTDFNTDIQDPLISVIRATTTRDSPEFLAEAVESILHQSYRNLEFLIITDGELDARKKEYLDGVKSKDKRVRILSTGGSDLQAHETWGSHKRKAVLRLLWMLMTYRLKTG